MVLLGLIHGTEKAGQKEERKLASDCHCNAVYNDDNPRIIEETRQYIRDFDRIA